jgi:hypothetical protein
MGFATSGLTGDLPAGARGNKDEVQMSSSRAVFRALWAMHPQRFWLIWIALTASALAYITWELKTHITPPVKRTTHIALVIPGNIMTSILPFALLAAYIVMILIWVDFSDYDDSIFVLTTLRGHQLGLTIWPVNGRFWPFALTEFNLAQAFGNSVISYYALPVIELLIVTFILLILDSDLGMSARSGILAMALLTPSVFLTFSTLVCEERTVLLFFLTIVLATKYFEKTRSKGWALTAVFCSQLMLYFKETSFLLLLGFAAGRLFLRSFRGFDGKWHSDALRNDDSRLDLCLAFLSVSFLLCYLAVLGIHPNISYAYENARSTRQVMVHFLEFDLLSWLFVAIALGRGYLIIRYKVVPSLLWDGVAVGGLAFFLGYQSLHLFSAYYMAPVDVLAILYLGRLVMSSWKRMPNWGKMATSSVALFIALQNFSFLSLIVFEQKNYIHSKVEIGSILLAKYRARPDETIRLFFPFASPYVIMEFAYYLTYRGIPQDRFTVATRTAARDGPCVRYRSLICHAEDAPTRGDLVVILPEDEASSKEASTYREGGDLLFFYEPRVPMAKRLYSVVGNISLAATRDKLEERPDRWMDASVTAWN